MIVLKFDRYTHLKQWLESDVRRQWIEKAKPLVVQDQTIEILTGLETWFTLPGKPLQPPPARYKMVLLTGTAVFVMSMLVRALLGPLLNRLPLWLSSLVAAFIVVALLTYVVMPRLTRLFYRWLYPR